MTAIDTGMITKHPPLPDSAWWAPEWMEELFNSIEAMFYTYSRSSVPLHPGRRIVDHEDLMRNYELIKSWRKANPEIAQILDLCVNLQWEERKDHGAGVPGLLEVVFSQIEGFSAKGTHQQD